MTADLAGQRPVTLTEDSVADALVAAMTVTGLYPPVRRGDQRLVDAVVLTPVPTAALAEVDVTIAVNLLGRQALPAWPGAPEPERATRDRDPVVESLELASFGAAAAQTDVPKAGHDEVVGLLLPMRDEIVEVKSSETGTPLPDDFQAAPPLS